MYRGIRPSFWSSRRTSSQTHQNLRAEIGPADTAVREIYGPLKNLQCTAAYVQAFGATEGLAVKIHQILRAETVPGDTAVIGKLFGPWENIQCTAAYVPASGVPDFSLSRSTRF